MNALLLGAVALGDKIETFGAYFGYAAVIGLGVLSLLYFAQAKEVKRLREWAGRAPERDADLMQRAQSDVSRRVVAQPIVAQPGVAAPAGPQTPAAQQAEAARKAAAAAVMQKFQPGAGAPAAGTPAVAPPGQLARPGGLGVQPGPAAPASPAPAAGPGAGTATPGAPAAPSAPGAPTTVGPSPGPALPPSAANAGAIAAARQAAIAGRSPASSSNGDAHDPLNPPISRLPDVPSRQPREVPLPSDRGGGRSTSRLGLIVGGVVTVLVLAVAVVLLLSAGGDSPPKDNPLGNATPPPSATKPPPARRRGGGQPPRDEGRRPQRHVPDRARRERREQDRGQGLHDPLQAHERRSAGRHDDGLLRVGR